MIKGYATTEGTATYKAKFSDLKEGHFRQKQDLWFSSMGIGSYLGEPDDATDQLYVEALQEAILSGINVIDSAINYRFQRSERAFGKAVAQLIEQGKVKREELILCTKGGFLSFDGNAPEDPRAYLKEHYFDKGLLKMTDIAQNCHAINPQYIEDQLEKSLSNLGVETIDIYYLHNPETQLAQVDQPTFLGRMRKAFELLEKKVSEGKIRMYGTATWTGYRVAKNNKEHLSAQELSVLAREVGGANHHFKIVQLPFNLAMPEAWVMPNQSFGANEVPFLGMAERVGLTVIGSASLLQSKLTGELPEALAQHFKTLQKSSQCAIQFARSVPGVTTSLVGMKSKQHVQENIETAKVAPLTEGELLALFSQ